MHVFLTGANGWAGEADGVVHIAFGLDLAQIKALAARGVRASVVRLPARSLTPEDAEAHFGGLAMWVAGNDPASSDRTRAELGWEPTHPGLLADIERPDYSA